MEDKDLGRSLDDIEKLLRKCVILKSDAHYVAETLWIAHTYAVECFDFTPRLAIWSPEKRCGKSLNLEIVSNLVSDSRVSSSISSSALFRMISKSESTVFLIDESDRVFGGKGDKEKAEALTQIINSGFKRGASVWRCEGTSFEPKEFATFAPVALAGIGTRAIPETIADRALVVEMRRKYPKETIFEFESDQVEEIFTPLREALSDSINSVKSDFRSCRPEFPNELHSRARDAWRSLFKIAVSAGVEWQEKAWNASLVLSAGEAEEDEMSFPLRLLFDIRTVFDSSILNSQELIARLHTIEEAPYGHGDHRLNTAQLARNLKQFGIKPTRSNSARFYRRDDFKDAWSRYLDPLEAVTPVTPVTIEDEPDSLW